MMCALVRGDRFAWSRLLPWTRGAQALWWCQSRNNNGVRFTYPRRSTLEQRMRGDAVGVTQPRAMEAASAICGLASARPRARPQQIIRSSLALSHAGKKNRTVVRPSGMVIRLVICETRRGSRAAPVALLRT